MKQAQDQEAEGHLIAERGTWIVEAFTALTA